MTLKYILIPLFFFIFAACEPAENNIQTNSSVSSVGQLQHTVFFYLNEDVSREEIAQFESGLQDLAKIEAIFKAEVGVPGPTEGSDAIDNTFAYSIYTWFKTMEDYNDYDKHPDHLEFINTYKHLWADIKVYDSDLTFSK